MNEIGENMSNLEILKEKYAEVLLLHCLRLKKGEPLLIYYELNENMEFVKIVEKKALELGASKVIIDGIDLYERRDLLLNNNIDYIIENNIGSRKLWDDVISEKGNILILSTVTPDSNKGVDPKKLKAVTDVAIKSAPIYYDGVVKYAFPWCICAVPNKRWADMIFPNDHNSLNNLWFSIIKMCMIDKADPLLEWEKFITKSNEVKTKLNSLAISKMRIMNSLGTDFSVTLPQNSMWINMDKSIYNQNVGMVNFPSYEQFITPHYSYTEGIVKITKPLVYKGQILENFSLVFKDGQVVEVIGSNEVRKVTESIFEYENARYLGEFAIVEKNSPINISGTTFFSTLFDENAKSHIALGRGSSSSIVNGNKMSDEELMQKGVNVASIHIDMMFGSDCTSIAADTCEGPKLIFKNGKFLI